jgi:hypothetical protein
MLAMPKPDPDSHEDANRWRLGEERHDLLESTWRVRLSSALSSFYAPEVLARLTQPDISRCPFGFAIRTLNTLLDEEPVCGAVVPGILTPEYWAFRQEAQQLALGMGESLMRVDVLGGRIRYRVVPSHCVEAEQDPDDPGWPIMVRETRQRQMADGCWVWTRETWRPKANEFKIEQRLDSGWVDQTAVWYKDRSIAPYPYVDVKGEPVLPYALFHSRVRNRLWSPSIMEELVSATYATGCMNTFFLHGMRDCANPTTHAINLVCPAAVIEPGSPGIGRIVRDPTTITPWAVADKTLPGTLFTIEATMEPLVQMQAIDLYVAAAYRDAGLGPTDEAPAKGVSGVAIQISRDSLRRSQTSQRPAARLADQRMLVTAARISNARLGTSYPTTEADYPIEYHGIPLSTDEVRAAVERVTTLLGAGLTTLRMALREVHPQLNATQIDALAREIEAEKRKARAAAPRPPAPPAAKDQPAAEDMPTAEDPSAEDMPTAEDQPTDT